MSPVYLSSTENSLILSCVTTVKLHKHIIYFIILDFLSHKLMSYLATCIKDETTSTKVFSFYEILLAHKFITKISEQI